ncbi:ROK family protein [Tessaracoccus sp. MC1865]|uniref:ROK family protein n=1 Tax=Tessaracoccus sp. MC1865 TaxID=2760310 RepID=UPI00160453B4|nr:ROK family protein [Tessaracoccus sp. MC1865]MBB1482953.1 ROK family protein [Tessaracoccus sp. MC1865]QTO37609.1 ROK family protein [Tessaracoccus sp. MC1865]
MTVKASQNRFVGSTRNGLPALSDALDLLSANAQEAAEVLMLMLDGGVRTRGQLISETGLARSAVGAQIDSLLHAGLLSPEGEAASTGGRPPVQFRFNPAARVVLAADLGASHATLALTDLAGRPIEKVHEQINIAQGPEEVLSWVLEQGTALIERSGRGDDLIGVGIGVPGPVEHSTGRPVRPPIMLGWDGFDIPARIRRGLPVPVLVDNDVNLMALGEHILVHRNVEHLLFVKVATGIGGGIIMGGRLHRGAKGAAGDLGHVFTPSGDGVLCRCGNTGCLEAVASGPAIAARLRAQGLNAETPLDVFKLAEGGNMLAAAELREAGRMIGDTLAACVSLLNPSVIVLGGVLSRAGDHLLAGVRERVYTRSLPLATGDLQILPAGTGRDAAVAGAAVMVTQHVLAISR